MADDPFAIPTQETADQQRERAAIEAQADALVVKKPGGDIDKNRPYGEVQGDPVAKYFQDGKFFDYAGKLIEEV